MFKKTAVIVSIILISGLSGIVFDRYVFPRLAATKLFSKYEILKKSAENVTVINKTEQVYMKEESSLDKIASQVSSSVVNIVSYPNPEVKLSSKNASSHNASPVKNGTGIIVTSDGLIMTSLNAINPDYSSPKADWPLDDKYKIITSDGTAYDAEISGIDSWSSLAFLKISASNLPAVSFGNSDELKAGEKIIAIGNSQGEYQNNFSSGIIAGFSPNYNLAGKALSMSDKMEGVFEISMGAQKNFVGGPIVDYSGQAVGMMGTVQKEGENLFFSVPSNKIKLVLDRAIKKELDKSYSLGIYYIPLTKTYALANSLSLEKGALIYSQSGQQGLAIISGSPASKADLKVGDIITQVNEEKIEDGKSLPDLLYKYKKGDEIEFSLVREGREMKTKVQL